MNVGGVRCACIEGGCAETNFEVWGGCVVVGVGNSGGVSACIEGCIICKFLLNTWNKCGWYFAMSGCHSRPTHSLIDQKIDEMIFVDEKQQPTKVSLDIIMIGIAPLPLLSNL